MEQRTDKPRDDVRPFKIEVADRVKRLPPYLFARINAKKYQMRRDGLDVIDLGMGNPSDPPEDLVIDKLTKPPAIPRTTDIAKRWAFKICAAKSPPSINASRRRASRSRNRNSRLSR